MGELLRRWEAFRADPSLPALQAWIEEWDRRFWAEDFGDFAAIYSADFRGVNRTPMPGVPEVRGPDGFAALRRESAMAASRFWFDIQQFEPAGDAFAGLGRLRARGRFTGLLLQMPWAVVWTLDGDRIATATTFSSPRRAREALATAVLEPA